MLPIAVIQEIRHLLDEGQLSQRQIATQLRVSRGIVGAIASGRRGIYGREPEEEDATEWHPTAPPERCTGCGAMVYKPCLLCDTRGFQARQKLLELLSAKLANDHLRVA